MKSLGVIETRGLVAAIQAIDAACKAASVTCIGYRKVGSGLVSVYFEGEISAIHTAIERGVAVAEQPVNSLVIARPEASVVEALSHLKGRPLRTQAHVETPKNNNSASRTVAEPVSPVIPPERQSAAEDKDIALKKGKKA
jgi:microcompartment protein CcmL/EutN